jgi:hypothetical protein
MRYLGASGAVLAAAMTFSPAPLGQAARAAGHKPVVVSLRERNAILPLSRNSFSTITLAVERYMNPPTLLEGLAEINPATCTEVAVGAWTSTPDQLCQNVLSASRNVLTTGGAINCGAITTGTVTVTEGSGVCAGSTFTFATIYYEWTAHNNQSNLSAPINRVADTFDATWAAPNGSSAQFTFNILCQWSVQITKRPTSVPGIIHKACGNRPSSRLAPIQPLIFLGSKCKNSPRPPPARTRAGILNQAGCRSRVSSLSRVSFGL